MRAIHSLPLPKVLQELILDWVGNDINKRAKARANRIIETLGASQVVGDDKHLRDLIYATVNVTEDWAWNSHTDGSLLWRFAYRPTPMQREHMLLELGLDFGNCDLHPKYRDCSEQCRNGRNLERTGALVRGVESWFRCIDYWHNGLAAPNQYGWVGPSR